MPRSLEDAEPRSLPFLFGGLSRRSALRIKCFEIMHHMGWTALFYFSTLMSCVYSAVVVEAPGWIGDDRYCICIHMYVNLVVYVVCVICENRL